MRKDDKTIIKNFFKDNREYAIKLFNEEIYKYFKGDENNKNIVKISEENITKLNEILKYYKNYLFESKKDDINAIDKIIQNNEGNYEQYLNEWH